MTDRELAQRRAMYRMVFSGQAGTWVLEDLRNTFSRQLREQLVANHAQLAYVVGQEDLLEHIRGLLTVETDEEPGAAPDQEGVDPYE